MDWHGSFSLFASSKPPSDYGCQDSIYHGFMYRSEFPRSWRSATPPQRDLFATCCIVVAFYLGAWHWDLAEHIAMLAANYEFIQLDELPLVLLAVAIAATWFSRRRMRDLTAEIARRTKAEQEIAQLLEENRALSQHARQIQEDERRNLARDLHDDIGQHLTAIRLCAAALPDYENPQAGDHARRITEYAGHIQMTVKGLLQHLRPVALEEYGLIEAVQYLVAEWVKQNPDTDCRLDMEDVCPNLSENINLAIYRIIQESLTNVARHASATRVDIRIYGSGAEGSEVLAVEVQDDGVGMREQSRPACFGLAGIRERARELGGTFALISGVDAGVLIKARIPIPPADKSPG